MKKLPAYLAVVFLAVLLVGCGGGSSGSSSGGGGGGDTPTVEPVSIGSLDGTSDVAADSVFKYVFSQAIDTSTVNSSTFFVVPTDEAAADIAKASLDSDICDPANAIAATVSCSSTTECTLTPTSDLSGGTEYSICLTRSIKFSNGQAFAGFTASFTTAGGGSSSSSKAITSYSILGVAGTIRQSNKTISLTVPYGTDVTALIATFVTTGESVTIGNVTQVSGTTTNDFSSPVVYTVTAADGTTAQYTVTVTVALNSAKDITAFSILGVAGTVGSNTVSLTVPYGTDVTALTPTIAITGESVSPASGGAQDFTNPVIYTVTAANSSTKNYTVTVTVALNSAKDITAFSILGVEGTMGANTVSLTVPYGTDVTALTPTITITGASVSPASGVPQNFTTPATYTVTAADSSTKDYTVTVTVALNTAKDITAFSILGVSGTVGANAVSLTVPYGTDVTVLTPTITITGASVSPASGVPQNFTTPVTYTVTAANNTTKDYTVTVTVALNSAKNITAFSILGIAGTIGSNTVSLTVPYGTNVTALTPTITITGKSVSPASGATRNFTNPVIYKVTAADSTTKNYTVTVTVAPSSEKNITAFSILGISGTVDWDTVSLTVPYGTDVTDLTPTIEINGASVSPASGVPHNFTTPATYTVTAADNTTKDYTVTVSVDPGDAKAITSYSILGNTAVINESAKSIALTVPYRTNATALVATFETTGASVKVGSDLQASGVTPNDFTSPVAYTVTAANGSTVQYTVTVTVGAYRCFVYVSNGISGTVDGYSINMTTGALTGVSGVSAGSNPFTIAANPSGTLAYVVNANGLASGGVRAFYINAMNGTLGELRYSPFEAETLPISVAVDPSDKYAYVANQNSGNVSAYKINATTGDLGEISGSPFVAGAHPFSVTVDPSGRFVYVAGGGAYTINPETGALTAIAGSQSVSGSTVVVDPSGRFAYSSSYNVNGVRAYAINATTGALTQIAGSPFTAGTMPMSVAVDPSGKYVYTANTSSSNVSAFTINAETGALAEIAGSPFAAGTGPSSVAVDPSGNFVYVANQDSNNISAYMINAETGALTEIAGSPFGAGSYPWFIVVVGIY